MESTLYKLFIDTNITGKLLTKNDLHDKNKHEVVWGAESLKMVQMSSRHVQILKHK